MAWVAAIAALASAGAGAYASNEASKSAKKGNDAATQAQLNSLLALLQMNEPARGLGYQAMGDLSSLYGYNMAPYSSLDQLASTVRGGYGSPYGSAGATGAGLTSSSLAPGQYDITPLAGRIRENMGQWDPLGSAVDRSISQVFNPQGGQPMFEQLKNGNIWFNGANSGKKFWGGEINPYTGEVKVNNDEDGSVSAMLTNYLRTGEGDIGKQGKRFQMAVEAMKNAGWDWQKQQQMVDGTNPGAWTPGGGPIKPNQNAAGEYAYADGMVPTSGVPNSGTANPTAGNFGRFFASPDYQFRQQEGVKALDRGAAARGGVLSGNRLRAGTELSSNLAAGEYGNYFNRLMAMVTGTQANTNNASNAVMSTGGTLAQLAQDNGVARASGIMGIGNSVMNGINSGLNGYYMNRYLNSSTPQFNPSSPANSFAPNYSNPVWFDPNAVKWGG